jgi:hypothetical protein
MASMPGIEHGPALVGEDAGAADGGGLVLERLHRLARGSRAARGDLGGVREPGRRLAMASRLSSTVLPPSSALPRACMASRARGDQADTSEASKDSRPFSALAPP